MEAKLILWELCLNNVLHRDLREKFKLRKRSILIKVERERNLGDWREKDQYNIWEKYKDNKQDYQIQAHLQVNQNNKCK